MVKQNGKMDFMQRCARALLILTLMLKSSSVALAAGPAVNTRGPSARTNPATVTAARALELYSNKQFVAASDAFEQVIKTSAPEPRLYYYAALANKGALREQRARQLYQYICQYFAQSPECTLAKMALGQDPLTSTGSSGSAKDANQSLSIGVNSNQAESGKLRQPGAFAFTAAEIAREGANGIDQSGFENCWFEAAMSALAQLPRGQRLIASMIKYGEDKSYIIRFPGDGKEYVCRNSDLRAVGLANTAKWASLLEYAQTQKFPNNKGAEGTAGDQSRLEVGMACITGRPAEIITPRNVSITELASFIGGAVRSQNPITCGTYDENSIGSLPRLVFGSHAYTIIGFEPSRNMVVIRNPHGHSSRVFNHPSDPRHLEFEWMGDGVFKMSLSLFQNYFHSVARSFL
ncbi:MAG: hypothetical protein KA255_04325 [Candidatus Obscuribacter sp.]|nr:hypothetical protein [Candidatus Obscuribacter sp.]